MEVIISSKFEMGRPKKLEQHFFDALVGSKLDPGDESP